MNTILLSMAATEIAVTASVAFIVGVVLAVVVVRILDNVRKKDAATEAKRIVSAAEEDAQRQIKAAELEAKEIRLTAQAEKEEEFQALREDIKERERSVLKREKVLDQTAENLTQQEKLIESTKRKLTEKIGDVQLKR
ncbi:MAG: DUF3552 domain-containing protein, partial [Treponema sp.]|nr:DUF3552 domain-containing protein [Treponema sp.]